MSWQQDKRWSDRFLPEIKQILGLHLIGEPPMEEDAERNNDLPDDFVVAKSSDNVKAA